jgi:hypothetical protein
MSHSTQMQALSALLFLCRDGLGRPLGMRFRPRWRERGDWPQQGDPVRGPPCMRPDPRWVRPAPRRIGSESDSAKDDMRRMRPDPPEVR